jgi:hypothetical protein
MYIATCGYPMEQWKFYLIEKVNDKSNEKELYMEKKIIMGNINILKDRLH